MAGVVARLVFFHRLGQEEEAPVAYAPDDAAVGEDEGAGCADDAVGIGVSVREGRMGDKLMVDLHGTVWCGGGKVEGCWYWTVLFDFADVVHTFLARAGLLSSVPSSTG